MNTRFLLSACMVSVFGFGSVGCQSNDMVDSNRALRSQNLELQNELEIARAARVEGDTRNSLLEEENSRLRSELAAARDQQAAPQPDSGFAGIPGTTTGTNGDGSIFVRVSGDVLFASGSDTLQGDSLSTLNEIVNVISERYPNNRIRIAGHTDTDRISRSDWEDNWELSCARALSVLRHLASQGVNESNLYAAGYGEFQARATKPESRRVEIIVETR